MSAKSSFLKELKGLGEELAQTVKAAKSSKEFKDLETQLAHSLKAISASLEKSIQAAKKSPHTGKIKRKFGRVVKVGSTKGVAEAKKARETAMKKFTQAKKALNALSAKLKKR